MWQRDTSGECSDEDEGSNTITDGSTTTYEIMGLEEDSNYTISVTAVTSNGRIASNPVTAMTMEAGDRKPL